MPNRLAQESSPYLQQHADNPVDWYPWGAAAFAEARAKDKPILLSIGYAACHWCHVMAHESFEDATTAKIMNDLFVNVKVDREERPDVDSIYMQAVQAISGHGGWPMTMFLTPDGVPFFGGTYYPPEDRHGMPSFQRILVSVSEAWKTRRHEVLKGADTLRGIYEAAEAATSAGESLTAEQWSAATRSLVQWYDVENFGFGRAPKFPQPLLIEALLIQVMRPSYPEALGIAGRSLGALMHGGIYDQLGGGFHRYCVDQKWLVPHFEKMLYDNALIARAAVHFWQLVEDPLARRVAEETFAWVIREMTDPRGGWYASLDADSEGHEGKFYVWSFDELRAALGPDLEIAALHWGASEGGNFEGANILHVAVPIPQVAERLSLPESDVRAALARAKAKLFAAREPRVRPARDEKVLAGWNGLMLRAMAEGARAFDDAALREHAVRAARFLRDEMMRDGRVMRSWRDGSAKINGFLEDHAALALGFISVYQLTFDRSWLDVAFTLHESCFTHFWSDEHGAWFDTAGDAEPLVTRPRDVTDNAVPSGTSLAVELDLVVAVLRDDAQARRRAEYVLATLAEPLRRSPLSFGHLLCAADLDVHGPVEVAIVGDPNAESTQALVREVSKRFLPSLVLVGGLPLADEPLALLRDRDAGPSGAQAFFCRNYRCELPTSDPAELRRQLDAAFGITFIPLPS